MGWVHRQRFSQFSAPSIGCLVLAGIDQVKTDAVKGGAGDGIGRLPLGHGMHTAQAAQIIVVQRLHPDGDSVDPRIAVARKAARFD